MRVTRLRSSAMMRRDQGGGPIWATTSPTRVRSGGPASGAVGPRARRLMTIVTGDSTVDMGEPPGADPSHMIGTLREEGGPCH